MKERAPRKYHHLWQLIKKREEAKVICDARAVKTIKKGVIMEKWRDEGFKIVNEIEKPFIDIVVTPVPALYHEPQEVQIEFILRTKFGIVDIIS